MLRCFSSAYIGGSSRLTTTYRPAEKAKVQGTNEMIIFTVQAISEALRSAAQ